MSRWQFAIAYVLSGVLFVTACAEGSDPPEAADGQHAADSVSEQFHRIRQLVEASEHLKAAGSFDLAQEVREEAESLWVQEAVRLEREQKEFEELSLLFDPAQIVVQALIAETSVLPEDVLDCVINEHGGKLLNENLSGDETASAVLLAHNSNGSAEIRSLADVGQIDVLSRPQIVALDGMQAQIHVGQVVPVVSGFPESESGEEEPNRENLDAGISLTITPDTVPDGQIRLELLLERTRVSENNIPVYADPVTGELITSPVIDRMTLQTACLVPDGRALMMPVLDAQSADDAEYRTLLLVLKPRIITDEE